ncbi:MAG: LacI family DNA-binding transcriptional regulator [Rhodothermales bacterium]|nr:LacI family DNA-binding transcriptional regulator [Rhodothermales bacterium]
MAATIYDIAREAGVSIATVSRVQNNHTSVSPATRKKVLEVCERLSYQPNVPARNLALQSSSLISAVVPMVGNYFYNEVLRGFQDRLKDSDFELMVFTAQNLQDVDPQLSRAVKSGLSAGALLLSTPVNEKTYSLVKNSRSPVVVVDTRHPDIDTVSVDNEYGGHLATSFLISKGYRKIGLVMASKESQPAAARYRGYVRAITESGMMVDDQLVYVAEGDYHHGYSETSGYQGAKKLLEASPDIDAIFATSDVQAFGAMHAVRESGLNIPDDVAVIGYDDLSVSRHLGLTTVRQPMFEMGRTAVERLLSHIDRHTMHVSETVFYPDLVERATTKTL